MSTRKLEIGFEFSGGLKALLAFRSQPAFEYCRDLRHNLAERSDWRLLRQRMTAGDRLD
jgi:hypothetical protein